jgi:type 1 glutamine amidotransferase
MITRIAAALALACAAAAPAQETPPPVRALLLIGGCCHDYATQKDILKRGIESRANVRVDIIYSEDTSTAPKFPIYGNPNYADGYDVVIHDECASDINDAEVVEGVLAPHKAGVPAVNLHCAMHCYRTAKSVAQPVGPGTTESLWFDFLGVQSSGHGPQRPIAVSILDAFHPTVAGMDGWTTGDEELYNNVVVHRDVKLLARGVQEPNRKPGYTDAAVVWAREYGENKARVWCTSLGHNNETVQDSRYLDLVTRGLLWACGKLNDDGTPAAGYEK